MEEYVELLVLLISTDRWYLIGWLVGTVRLEHPFRLVQDARYSRQQDSFRPYSFPMPDTV